MSRLYNYVNFDLFQNLPVTGTNGEPFVEEIINVDPQVIVMSSYASQDPDELSQKQASPLSLFPEATPPWMRSLRYHPHSGRALPA